MWPREPLSDRRTATRTFQHRRGTCRLRATSGVQEQEAGRAAASAEAGQEGAHKWLQQHVEASAVAREERGRLVRV